MSQNILIISPEILKDRVAVHSNMDDKLIYPEIKAAQDMYILPLLGTALFDKILSDISGGTLAGDYKTLVDSYLIDTLCNYVMAEMPDAINYQFTNKGVVTKTADTGTAPSISDMYNVVDKYKKRAEHYEERTRRYLMQSIGVGKFPEYVNPGSGVDTILPERTGFTSPIYLGEEKPHYKRSFEERFQGNRPNCC